jgi:hypothetical protein
MSNSQTSTKSGTNRQAQGGSSNSRVCLIIAGNLAVSASIRGRICSIPTPASNYLFRILSLRRKTSCRIELAETEWWSRVFTFLADVLGFVGRKPILA